MTYLLVKAVESPFPVSCEEECPWRKEGKATLDIGHRGLGDSYPDDQEW